MLKPELKEIVDEMEFESDEDRAAFEKSVSGKAGEKLLAGYMKNRDYTTKTSTVATERKALEDARKKFDEEQEYLLSTTATWKKDMEGRLASALKQTADSDLRGAALTSKLRAIAAQYGEDPDELLKDVQTARADDAPTTKTEPAAIDDRYVSKQKFDEASNAVFAFAPMIRDFERDYKKTFGKEYDGSITDLVREVSPEIEKQRARGRNVDLFGLMREKLDFNGQAERNKVTQAAEAEAARVKWEEEKTKEIETNLRSQILADNPAAFKRTADESEKWRENLGSKARNNDASTNQLDDFNRRKALHEAFERNVAKVQGAA